MKRTVKSFDKDDAIYKKNTKDLLNKKEMKVSLAYIRLNFGFLSEKISYLEKRSI